MSCACSSNNTVTPASSEASGRARFLNQCRAICDRRASTVNIEGSGGRGHTTGLELFRIFLLDLFNPVSPFHYKLVALNCRHSDRRPLTDDKGCCQSGGVLDINKAAGFVMSDFKRNKLRKWLFSKTAEGVTPESDIESDDDEDDDDQEVPLPSQSSESFDQFAYPSSSQVGDDGKAKRKTTKQRLCLLAYLSARAREGPVHFKAAWDLLIRSDEMLLHLCGCGLGKDTSFKGCVSPSHLKLGSQELNNAHTHIHFTFASAQSVEGYRTIQSAVAANAEFADVF